MSLGLGIFERLDYQRLRCLQALMRRMLKPKHELDASLRYLKVHDRKTNRIKKEFLGQGRAINVYLLHGNFIVTHQYIF